MGQEEYRELSSFLKRFVRRAKVIRGVEGLCLTGVAALLIITLGLGIQEIKALFPYAPLAYSLLAAAVAIFLAGWIIFHCVRNIPTEQAARYIEERQPQLRNNLINSLQLYPQVADEKRAQDISTSMILSLLRITRTQLQKIQVKDLISTDRLKAELRLLALLLVPAIALVLFYPTSVEKSFSLLVNPLKDLPPSETLINVTPKGTRVTRGSSVTVRASAAGAIPKSMELIFSFETGKGEDRPSQDSLLMDNLGDGKFSATIQGVQRSLQFRVATGPFSSPWYAIEAIDPPEVGNLKISVYPPHYTGLPMQNFKGGNADGIKGSTFRLEGQSNKDLAKAKILLEEGREVPLQIKERRLQGSLVLFQPQKYQILVEDTLGFQNSPIPYELRVLPDGFPTVDLLKPTEDLEINGDETLALDFSARDDFGIQEVTLVIKIGDKEERISIRKNVNKKLMPRERYHWDVGGLGLSEGEEATYFLEVLDNDTISGPKMGSSQALRLRLKNLRAEHKQVTEMIRDLSTKMVDILGDHLETPLSSEKEPLPDVRPSDKPLDQKLAEAMEQIDKIMERTEKDRFANFATWADLESLKRNMEFTKEELLPKKSQASSPEEESKVNDEISSELERMALLAEEISKMLTAQEIATSAQDLMKGQERLMESLEKLSSGDKKLDQVLEEISKLAKELAQLQQSLAKMATQLPDEFINNEAMQGLQLGDMSSALDEIRKKLKEGDIQGAMQLARELFNQMASMLASLRSGQQRAMSSQMGRMQGEMMRSASELEQIVREQQEILVGTEGVQKESLKNREGVQKQKLDQFEPRAMETLTDLARLFPDQDMEESEEFEGREDPEESVNSTEIQFDEFFRNQVIKGMMAQLKEKDLSALAEFIENARKELAENSEFEKEERKKEADRLLENLMESLKALLEEPAVPLSGEQKEGLRDLASRQAVLKERTIELYEKLKSLFQLFPALDPKIIKNINEASASMFDAQYQLGDLNAKMAIPPEEDALERLSDSRQQMQDSLQRLARRGQLGRIPVVYLFRRGRFIPSGRLFPLPGVPELPEFDMEGGATGLSTEKFKLPGKGEYKAPRRFREEILESLKQGIPEQFKDQIETYFKDLSQ